MPPRSFSPPPALVFIVLLFFFFLPGGFVAIEWSETHVVTGSDDGHGFGTSVAISGQIAVLGSPFEDDTSDEGDLARQAGCAYVHDRASGGWHQSQVPWSWFKFYTVSTVYYQRKVI